MSERITGELRRAMRIGYAVEGGEQVDAIRHGAFMDLCDAIDAVHANLERENDELRKRLAEPSGSARSIGSATVTITPTLDWTAFAEGLRELAALCERTKEVGS